MLLEHHGLPVIVALNRFGSDTERELERIWPQVRSLHSPPFLNLRLRGERFWDVRRVSADGGQERLRGAGGLAAALMPIAST
jgi:hypothetical protein